MKKSLMLLAALCLLSACGSKHPSAQAYRVCTYMRYHGATIDIMSSDGLDPVGSYTFFTNEKGHLEFHSLDQRSKVGLIALSPINQDEPEGTCKIVLMRRRYL